MEHFTIQYSIIWLKVLIIFFVKYDQFRNYRKLKNFPVLWRRVISLKIEIFGDLIQNIFEHQIDEISKISILIEAPYAIIPENSLVFYSF